MPSLVVHQLWLTSFESPLRGLILAVKDPKVWIFSALNVAQLLGLGFVNFFPT